MKRSKWLLMPLAAVALSVAAAWSAPGGGTTVGEFAFKISTAMGHRPADQVAAAKALMKAGVNLGTDIRARLTWSRAASILHDLGLRVTPPADPASEITAVKADRIANLVAMTHGRVHGGSGRHHGRGCPPSPKSPDDCDDDDDDDDDDHGHHDDDHDHHGGGHDHHDHDHDREDDDHDDD